MAPHNIRIAAAAAAFLFIHHSITKKKKKKRVWTKTIIKNRMEYGNKFLREMSMDNIVQNFTRMTLNEFEHLCSLLDSKIRKNDTNFREAITVKERVLITLRYLATGESYTCLQYLFHVSKQSISTIVPEVCDAIIEAFKEYVKIPSSEQEWLNIAEEFEKKWNFPHVIAAMDGKHVMLQSPMNSGNDYDNYKQFPSIVLFALVDAKYRFLYIDVGSKGQISDGGVFKSTTLYKKLERGELNIPLPSILQMPYSIEVPYFILGDKAFALNDYTMEPYEGTPERCSMEIIFNYRLSRARRVVDNAFGILSSVYRVLRKPILLEPEKATKVVLATIHLYNYLRTTTASDNFIPPGSFDSEENGYFIPGHWRNEHDTASFLQMRAVPRSEGNHTKEIRSHLARHFITNGEIPWQNDYQ